MGTMEPFREEMLNEEIRRAKRVYLYGAGIIAYGVREALRESYGIHITAHIVTRRAPGETSFVGVPVREVTELPAQLPEAMILVATPPIYHADIAASLRQATDARAVFLDERMQFDLRRPHTKDVLGLQLIDDIPQPASVPERSLAVYMARSSHDRALQRSYTLPSYIHPVQAGTALDTTRLAGILHDDKGENISTRNRDYSETTVTYWAWKHSREDYLGICHYRRRLDLRPEDLAAFLASDADAILPLPYLCAGDASFQYRRYVSDEDLALLRSCMTDEERAAFDTAMALPYLYNHNIVLAKRAVFEDYAARMFAILQRVDEKEAPKGWRNDRHMGYFAELLTSAYFTNRAKKLQIVHVPEVWMV